MSRIQFRWQTLILCSFFTNYKVLSFGLLNEFNLLFGEIICILLFVIRLLVGSHVLRFDISKFEIALLEIVACHVSGWCNHTVCSWIGHSLDRWLLVRKLLTADDRLVVITAECKIILPTHLHHFFLIKLALFNAFWVLLCMVNCPIDKVLTIWFLWHFYLKKL